MSDYFRRPPFFGVEIFKDPPQVLQGVHLSINGRSLSMKVIYFCPMKLLYDCKTEGFDVNNHLIDGLDKGYDLKCIYFLNNIFHKSYCFVVMM